MHLSGRRRGKKGVRQVVAPNFFLWIIFAIPYLKQFIIVLGNFGLGFIILEWFKWFLFQARNQDFLWGGVNEAKVDQTTEIYFVIV